MTRAPKPPANRGGRPPADPNNRRNRTVPVKLSSREEEDCRIAAEREGKAFSEWARDAMLLRAYASG